MGFWEGFQIGQEIKEKRLNREFKEKQFVEGIRQFNLQEQRLKSQHAESMGLQREKFDELRKQRKEDVKFRDKQYDEGIRQFDEQQERLKDQHAELMGLKRDQFDETKKMHDQSIKVQDRNYMAQQREAFYKAKWNKMGQYSQLKTESAQKLDGVWRKYQIDKKAGKDVSKYIPQMEKLYTEIHKYDNNGKALQELKYDKELGAFGTVEQNLLTGKYEVSSFTPEEMVSKIPDVLASALGVNDYARNQKIDQAALTATLQSMTQPQTEYDGGVVKTYHREFWNDGGKLNSKKQYTNEVHASEIWEKGDSASIKAFQDFMTAQYNLQKLDIDMRNLTSSKTLDMLHPEVGNQLYTEFDALLRKHGALQDDWGVEYDQKRDLWSVFVERDVPVINQFGEPTGKTQKVKDYLNKQSTAFSSRLHDLKRRAYDTIRSKFDRSEQYNTRDIVKEVMSDRKIADDFLGDMDKIEERLAKEGMTPGQIKGAADMDKKALFNQLEAKDAEAKKKNEEAEKAALDAAKAQRMGGGESRPGARPGASPRGFGVIGTKSDRSVGATPQQKQPKPKKTQGKGVVRPLKKLSREQAIKRLQKRFEPEVSKMLVKEYGPDAAYMSDLEIRAKLQSK